MIEHLMWHYVEDYDFYYIEYVLDGYFHRIQLSGWNVDTDVPTFICKQLRAELNCEPEQKVFR